MHRSLKRTIAVAALAPLALFAGAGGAGAVVVPADPMPTSALDGDTADGPHQTSARCEHPSSVTDVPLDSHGDTSVVEFLGFDVDIQTSDAETGFPVPEARGPADIKSFQWTAVDNNQNPPWYEKYASVKRVSFSYLNSPGPSPSFDDVIAGPFVVGKSARDGEFTNSRRVKDVTYMKWSVTWDMSGPGDPSDRTVTCYIPMD